MSRNSSSSNLRKDSSTPTSLVEFPLLKDREATATPGSIPSRTSSPAVTPTQQVATANSKFKRVPSARDVREGSPARTVSSASIARMANSAASQANNVPTPGNAEQQLPLSPRPQRPINPSVPHWPTSPRLSLSRSPPPASVRSPSLTSPRRVLDSTVSLPAPSMAVRDKESPGKGRSGDESSDGSSYFHHSGPHTAHRPPRPIASPAPALETVTESSLPSTPAIGMGDRSIDARLLEAEQRRYETSSMSTRASESSISSRAQESESDTGNMSDRKPPSRAPSRISRRPTINSTKGADSSGEMKGEIETVVSVPQQIGTAGPSRLQRKTSQETIRPPKKEKRKQKRSAPGPNTQTKKADIFEQRINDTLDDAESSDSEETYVYESNPVDKRPRHSRASSVTSLSDPRRPAIDNPLKQPRRNKFGTGHKSNNNVFDDYTSDGVGGSGTIRASQQGLRGHVGRGYTNPNLDDSASSTGGTRLSHHRNTRASHHISSSRNSSRPGSPRHSGKHIGNNGTFVPYTRREASKLTSYEGDIEGEADETTPLARLHNRNGGHYTTSKSRPNSMSRQQLEYNYARNQSWYTRIACCALAIFGTTSLIIFVLGLVFLITKPLENAKLINITDIIATKQEVIFNMDISVLNPNLLPITVKTVDLRIFVKSPYVKGDPDKHKDKDDQEGSGGDTDDDGTNTWWRSIMKGQLGSTSQRRRRRSRHINKPKAINVRDGVDKGTDPIQDPEDAEIMQIGRIFQLDTAMVFEGSPFRRISHTVTGEARLSNPGNGTESAERQQWEDVLSHTFDLIVRGNIRYQLPFDNNIREYRNSEIHGSVSVHPEDGTVDNFRDHIGLRIDPPAEGIEDRNPQ